MITIILIGLLFVVIVPSRRHCESRCEIKKSFPMFILSLLEIPKGI
jgi:hypothetical protein